MTDQTPEGLDRIAVLAEPIRRRLYEYVVAQAAPVDRDGAASALRIGRPLAAFHLDRLVERGLLDVEYHRRSGRTGPGAGRPAKFYRRSEKRHIEVSLPPRRYGVAAKILADGIDQSPDGGVVTSVMEAARAAGERLAAAMEPAAGRAGLIDVLRGHGYEPHEATDGTIRLRNCPFDDLVDDHRQLTCSMNLAMLGPVAERLPDRELVAEARPSEGWCCVAFVPGS